MSPRPFLRPVLLRPELTVGLIILAALAAIGALFLVSTQTGVGMVSGLTALLMVTLLTLVTARQARLALGQRDKAERLLTALVHHASDMIFVIDPDGRARYVSPSAERILQVTSDALVGRDLMRLVHPDDVESMRHLIARLQRLDANDESLVIRALSGADEWKWLEVVGTNLLQMPDVRGLVLNVRDVSHRRELENRLSWQAFHDATTGLANRVLFNDRVTHALSRREREFTPLAVMFIDLDDFKMVNDTFGHSTGDELLRQVARRIELEVRAVDTVARLGGDEFAILMEQADADMCETTAHRLLSQLQRPFLLDGRETRVRASVGVSQAEAGETADTLLRSADIAMYVAKSEGGARVVRFDPAMRDRITDRLDLEADLRTALERSELQVYYQPQIDLATGELVGAEALLRWHHPTRGLISPGRFIPIAEEAGLIGQISRHVLQVSCRDAMTWHTSDPDAPLHVAVNLSGRHMQAKSVVDEVQAALDVSGLPPSRLTIELTESVMIQNADEMIATMRALKAIGVTIALDDFGTGYSSLSYLQRFPIDVLKLDRSFIQTLGSAASDDALTRAILGIGESLGLATVAEGIETERQLTELQSMGCMLGQGFLLSQPVNAAAFLRLVQSGEPLHRSPSISFPRNAA